MRQRRGICHGHPKHARIPHRGQKLERCRLHVPCRHRAQIHQPGACGFIALVHTVSHWPGCRDSADLTTITNAPLLHHPGCVTTQPRINTHLTTIPRPHRFTLAGLPRLNRPDRHHQRPAFAPSWVRHYTTPPQHPLRTPFTPRPCRHFSTFAAYHVPSTNPNRTRTPTHRTLAR